jgi:hypothetical protein
MRLLGLGKLMAIIAVAAIDLAACRAIFTRSDHYGWNLLWLNALTPIGITLQVAFFRMAGARNGRRIFWTGFLTSGIMAMISVILLLSDPPSETTTISSSGTSVHSYPGGPMARLWGAYFELVYAGLERVGYPYIGHTTDWPSSFADAFIIFLPQLLMAWAGGLLARLIVGRRCLTSPRECETPA